MKGYFKFILILIISILLVGCGQISKEDLEKDLNSKWAVEKAYPSKEEGKEDSMAGYEMELNISSEKKDETLVSIDEFKSILKKEDPKLLDSYNHNKEKMAEIFTGLGYKLEDEYEEYAFFNYYNKEEDILINPKDDSIKNIRLMYLFNENKELIIINGALSHYNFKVINGLLYNKVEN